MTDLHFGIITGLTLEEISLRRGDGSVTDDYRRIYHIPED